MLVIWVTFTDIFRPAVSRYARDCANAGVGPMGAWYFRRTADAGHKRLGITMLMRKAASCGLVISAAFALVGVPSVAEAAGGNCGGTVQKKAVAFRPDVYRVAASCSSLWPNSKARGILDFPNDADDHTQWFTQLNVTVYSGYSGAVFGAPTGRAETAPV